MTTIKFNVGGERCQTLKSTLDTVPYFQSLFENWQKNNKNFEQEIFLDMDYDIFKQILNKLRDAQYEFPDNETVLNNINNMMKYFCIELKECKTKEKPCFLKHISIIKGIKMVSYETVFNLIIDTNENSIKDMVVSCYNKINKFSIKRGSHLIISVSEDLVFRSFFEYYHNKNIFRMKNNYLKLLKNVGQISITIEGYQLESIFCVVQSKKIMNG